MLNPLHFGTHLALGDNGSTQDSNQNKANMRRKKYHTFLIMPPTPGKRVLRFSFPTLCCRIFSGMAAAILLWAGAGIVATAKGKVDFVGKSRALGLMIIIRHDSAFTTE